MPVNADIFLEHYNRIEEFLRKSTDSNINESFMSMIRKSKNRFIQQNYNMFSQLSNLRNAISHQRGTDIYAEPTDLTISIIENIKNKLLEPKKVYDIINNKPVIIDGNSSLTQALEIINKCKFSQFPVYDGNKYLGLLSSNSIVLWFSEHIEDDEIIMELTQVKINDVLNYNESLDQAKFIGRNTDVVSFIQMMIDNKEISIWFITEKGDSSKILRIITPYDYEIIFNELNIT